MKFFVKTACILLAAVPSLVHATPEHDADFAARCSSPNVLRCVGFDSSAEVPSPPPGDYISAPAPYGVYPGNFVPPGRDTSNSASGSSSLKFTIPSNAGKDVGSYFTNFSDDFSVQFGEGSPHGKEFYVQWRQKFSPEFLATYYDGGGGWKQAIIGEGDRSDENIHSCTSLEVVVQNTNQRGFPQMYHSCGAKDGNYEPLDTPYGSYDFNFQNAMPAPYCLYSQRHDPESSNCFFYKANQWMTFQVRVVIGTAYKNDRNYKNDSTIQLWVAEEGQPARLVIDRSPQSGTGYDLYNDNPSVRHYGQVYLLPYHTCKESSQAHPDGYTWYDELIISKSRIADPGVPADSVAPAAPADINVQ